MAVIGHLSPPLHPSLLTFVAFSLALLLFSLVFVSFYLKKKKRPEQQLQQQDKAISTIYLVAPSCLAGAHQQQQDLPEWAPVGSSPPPSLLCDDRGSGGGEGEQEREDKKRKKRARKKKQESRAGSEGGEDAAGPGGGKDRAAGKHGSDCIYPFSSFSSATQRRIKQQYDQLVKSNQAKALTVAQVGQFANCLIEARNELQHKSEIIHRRFTIKRALLSKADRSSIDRLCQQIYKLEAEQKRLEEDAIVYNRLQEQLKLSPAYKMMLEIGARLESNASSEQAGEDTDSEFTDISFEELLAQEKKDSFWQRNGKFRSSVN